MNELPPHRPCDYKFKLKQNAKLHYGPIYKLTKKESITLKKYIKEYENKNLLENPNSLPLLLFSLFPRKTQIIFLVLMDYLPKLFLI